MSVVVVMSALSSSAATLSEPAALLFLSSLIAILISLRVGSSVFIGSSIGFGLNLGGFLGASLFRMHAKCSAQRANCPSLSVILSIGVLYWLRMAAGIATKFFSDLVEHSAGTLACC